MKKLSLTLAFVASMASVGMAKAQKMATLDVNALLSIMPEKKKADEQLEATTRQKRAEIEKQLAAAQEKFKKYQEEAPKQTAKVNEERQKEMQRIQENIQKMQAEAQKDMAEKTAVAYQPIEKKFYEAVEKVAKENGWDFVMDAASSGIIVKNGPDATPMVRKELGL